MGFCPFGTPYQSTRTHFRNGSMDFLGSFMKLSRLVVVQHHVIYPFGTYGLVHQPNINLWNRWMDFFLFEVLWNCLDLQLCSVLHICPFDQYGLAHVPEPVSLRPLGRLFIVGSMGWGVLLFSECLLCLSYNNHNPALGILWSWHRVATLCQDHRTPSTGLRLL